MPDLPFVSVIMPIRNEERYLATSLESVLASDYAHDRLEILVIDGMSTDRSREIVQDYAQRYPFLHLLDNPKSVAPRALNIGIGEAKGEIIVRMDAHALYAPDYVRQCVELLETTGAANVGGPQRAVGTNHTTNAIAVATTTPFGIGDAFFRYANEERWVDTVFPGAWRKSTLEALEGFNEEYVVNEDYELNYRLRQAGGKILVSPSIRCQYYVRGSLKALSRQYSRYGFWKVKTLIMNPDSLRWRQLAPPVLVVAFLLSAGILPVNWMLGSAGPALYLLVSLIASIWTASGRGWRYLPLLPIVFAAIHLSWGVGFLAGLFRWGWPRVTLSSLAKAFGPRS